MEEKGKKLGLGNLIGFGLGNAIGTGIFVMLGFGIASTGRSVSLALIAGCLVMFLASWVYVGMSTMFVFEAGDYGMRMMLSNPLLTGMNAWFTVINGFGLSSLGLAFTNYLCVLFPALEPHTTVVTFIVLTICFAVTVRGSRFLTLVENAITIVLVIALVTFIVFGVQRVDAANYFSSNDGGFFRNGLSGFVAAISIMSFVCMGQTATISMAAVTKNPKRTVPLSILCITCIMAVIYAAMGYVASGVLPYDQVAGQNISVTAQEIFPKQLFLFFVAGGGLCAIGSSILSTLGYVRYPMIQVSREGWLPDVFKKQTKSGYPYVTYGLYYIISIFPLMLDMDLDAVISLTMIPLMLIQFYMNLASTTLPKKFPQQWSKRSVKMPKWLFSTCGVLGAACAVVIIYNLFLNLTHTEMVVAVVLVAALLVLSAVRLKQGAVKAEDLEAQKRKIIEEALAADAE